MQHPATPTRSIPAFAETLRRELHRQKRPQPTAAGEALCHALTEWANHEHATPPLAEFREALCTRATAAQEAAACAMLDLITRAALPPPAIHTLLESCTAPGRFWFAALLTPITQTLPHDHALTLARRLLHDRSKRVRHTAIERCITCRCAAALLPTLKEVAATEPTAPSIHLSLDLIEHGYHVEPDELNPTRRIVTALVPGTDTTPPQVHCHSVSANRLNQLGPAETARRLQALWSRGQLLPAGTDP